MRAGRGEGGGRILIASRTGQAISGLALYPALQRTEGRDVASELDEDYVDSMIVYGEGYQEGEAQI